MLDRPAGPAHRLDADAVVGVLKRATTHQHVADAARRAAADRNAVPMPNAAILDEDVAAAVLITMSSSPVSMSQLRISTFEHEVGSIASVFGASSALAP